MAKTVAFLDATFLIHLSEDTINIDAGTEIARLAGIYEFHITEMVWREIGNLNDVNLRNWLLDTSNYVNHNTEAYPLT